MPKAAFSSHWFLSEIAHLMPAAWTALKSQPYLYSEEKDREKGFDENVERRIQKGPKP